MNSIINRQDTALLVLVFADSSAPWFESIEWENWGLRCLETSRSVSEACEAVSRLRPDLVLIDQSVTGGGMSALETITRSWPRTPVALVLDAGEGGGTRAAFIRGAFDCLHPPLTAEVVGGLVNRLRARIESPPGGGVFSTESAEAARRLLFGNASVLTGDLWPGDSQSWQAASIEVVPQLPRVQEIEALIEGCLAGSPALGLRENAPDGRTLLLSVLFYGRSAAKASQVAMVQTQNLVQRLNAAGAWAAAGLGSTGSAADIAASLQHARLTAGYSLARGPGVYAFRGDLELACPVCTDLDPCADDFPSRIQGGGDWQELVEPFFEALSVCASARRLQQEVQRLFSRIADLVPGSSHVERYYHIIDFVHGPGELRSELEALCSLASDATRTSGRSLADRKLHEFREYVARHYGEQLDLAVVCSALQISPSYLNKILRRSIKTTFVDFLTEVRMARSRELLSGTDLLTSQIAERVGFAYTHYFSALFKKRYATTPSEFRAWCRAQATESTAV